MRYLTLLSMLTLTLAACSESPEGVGEADIAASIPMPPVLDMASVQTGNPLLGAWGVTSVAVGDEEIVLPRDFSLILTFRTDNTYSLSATNTSGGFVCEEPQTSCTINGTYEYTATTITLNEVDGPEPGPDTGLYALCGGRLIYMDFEGNGDGIRFTFGRTRMDCYVNDCS